MLHLSGPGPHGELMIRIHCDYCRQNDDVKETHILPEGWYMIGRDEHLCPTCAFIHDVDRNTPMEAARRIAEAQPELLKTRNHIQVAFGTQVFGFDVHEVGWRCGACGYERRWRTVMETTHYHPMRCPRCRH